MLRSSCGCASRDRGLRAPTVAGQRSEQGLVGHYRRSVEPLGRGPLAVAVTVGVFASAGAVGSPAGLILASVWVLAMGVYCLANFTAGRRIA
jgi:hypothetical protein